LKKYLSIILILSVFGLLKANTLDSLNLQLSKTNEDTSKIKVFFEFLSSNKFEIEEKREIIKKLKFTTDNIFEEFKKDTSDKNLLDFLGIYYAIAKFYSEEDENIKKFTAVCDKQLELFTLINDTNSIATVYHRIGSFYKYRSDYEQALDYFLKSLDLKRKVGNELGISYAYIGIANVFINWKKYEEAIKYYKFSLNASEQVSDTIGIASSYTGMGNVYTQINNIPIALKNHKKAYKYYLAINDYEGIALSLLNLGDIYIKTKEYDKALKVYNEALKITIEKNYKIRTTLIYNKIAQINMIEENYNLAIEYYNKSLIIAKETNYRKVIVTDYEGLAKSYKQIGKSEKAYDYLTQFYTLKDSIFNEEKHKQLAEIETKYQTVQKEKTIKQQKFKLEKDKILNEKRTYQRNFTLIILLLVFIVLIFVVRGYRNKRKANVLLAKQRDKIEQQRNNVEKQKEIIEKIHYEVSESINYATKLQQAILPEHELLKNYLSEHFVLFKPKDKVSGDFYWWTYIEGHTIITAADCTGHGVPGAFMSMLGVSFLREIVEKEYITNTGLILKKLRKEIIKALKQKGATGEQKDGMDMSIISINHETNVVQFSGANNPLYLILNSELRILNEESSTYVKLCDNSKFKIQNLKLLYEVNKIQNLKLLYEVKPDKMPIAIYDKMDNFTTHEIQLQKGDQLYMFSDGFADQFGGEKGKKFKYKPFKRLLLENAERPMSEQKEILNTTFESWRGKEEQVDDVVVLGIKI